MPVWNKPNMKIFQHLHGGQHGNPQNNNSHSSPVEEEEGEISSPATSAANTSAALPNPGPASTSTHTHTSASALHPINKPHNALHSRPVHASRSGTSTFRPNIAVAATSTNLTGNVTGVIVNTSSANVAGIGIGNHNAGNANDTEEGEISVGPPSSSSQNRANANAMNNRNTNTNTNTNTNQSLHGNNSSGPTLGGTGGHVNSNSMNRSTSTPFHNPRRSSWQSSSSTYNNDISPKSKPPFKPKAKPGLGSYASLSETADKKSTSTSNDGHVKPDTHASSHINIPNWEPPPHNRSFQGRNNHYGDNHNHAAPPHPHHNPSFNERKRANRPWENNDTQTHHKRSSHEMPLKSPNKTSWRDNHRDRDHHNRDRDRDRRDTSKPWEKSGRFEHSYQKRNMSWRRNSADGLGGVGADGGLGGGGAGGGSIGGGGAGGGGSYYGPAASKRANVESDIPGHYGSSTSVSAGGAGNSNANTNTGIGQNKEREKESIRGVGNNVNVMKKYGPGPRFQPPPHVIKDKNPFAAKSDDGMFVNAGTGPRVEEDRDHNNNQGPGSSQRFQSPNELRLDGSLSTGRNQSHSSPSPYGSPSRKNSSEIKWKQSNNASSSSLANRFEAPEKNVVRAPLFVPPKREENQGREEGQIDWVPAKIKESAGNKASLSTTPVDGEGATTETPIPPTPAKFMCSALRDNDVSQKAMKVINMLSELISDESLKVEDISKSADSVPLPDADQITQGVQELKQRMKQGQQQLKLIKFKMRQAVQKDIQKKKEKEALDAKEEEERKSKAADLQKTEAEDLQADGKIALEKVEAGKMTAKKRVMEQISVAKASLKEVEGKIVDRIKSNEAANAIIAEKEIVEKYETIINAAQKLSKEAKIDVSVASKTVSEINLKLLSAERNLKDWTTGAVAVENLMNVNVDKAMDVDGRTTDTMREVRDSLSAVSNSGLDSPKEMKNLVTSIAHENKKRAAQAHYESVSIVVSEAAINSPDSTLPPELLPEVPIKDDNSSFEQYIAHWTKRTQRVTGPGDALYSEPSQAPLYDNIQENHQEMRLLVREHVRSKKRKLHHRWTELAQEYAVREQLYEKDTKRDSNSIHSAELGGSFSICGQRRGGGAESNSNIAGSFGASDTASGRATNNPYRRARRSAGFQVGGSDIVRSDYEQEQIIAQLTAQENMEKRIKLGGSDLPRQVCRLERDLSASYMDTMLSRRVDDALEDQRKHNLTNPWSDMEKCIFFDRFLQHPKDFRKIASFLKNKCTHDCIAFYYNSKQSVPYKAALKEHQMRKKRRGDIVSWEATVQAAISLGATVTAGLNSEKPLLFHLPESDQTFCTRLLHPVKLELFDPNASEITYEESKELKPRKKKKSELATTFTLDPSERKYLRVESRLEKSSSTSSDIDSMSSAKLSRSSSLLSVQDAKNSGDQKSEGGSKKGSNKWNNNEKTTFFDSLEKHGKKWEILSEAIGTKTATQTRNFYYDNKKQNEKGKGIGSGKESSKIAKKGGMEEIKNASSQHSNSNEKSLTADQIAMHLEQMNQAGGLQMPAPEHKNATSEIVPGMIPEASSNLLVNQQVPWHDNNQHQLALALEQHHRQQQLSEQQRFLEHQQQFDRHRLEQLAQQHIIDQQRQMQQQHLLDMLNQQQNDVVGGMPSWLAAQVLHQRQQQDLQSSQHFQNVAIAMRQLQHQRQQQQHQQSTMHLQPNGGIQGMNSNGELEQQQTSDLSILARMAADQQNRNL